jgi:hypothetical protein
MKNRCLRKNHAYNVIHFLRTNDYASAEDIAHEFSLHYKIAERHLRECWALDLIYISSWDRKHHHWVPVYRWGNRPDAAKPRPLTPQEVETRYAPKRRARRKPRKASAYEADSTTSADDQAHV